MADREVWDRLPDEKSRHFEAFAQYRDLGPQRSQAKVAEQLGKSETILARWSTRFDWVLRAEAWDDHQDKMVQVEVSAEYVEMRKRHAQFAKLMQSKALEKLQDLNAKTDLSPNQLTTMLAEAVKIERIAMGLPDGVTELRHKAGPDVGDIMKELLKDPELAAKADELAEALEGSAAS